MYSHIQNNISTDMSLCSDVHHVHHFTSRHSHLSSVVYQGPDKVILSQFNIILFRQPGGARMYPLRAAGTFQYQPGGHCIALQIVDVQLCHIKKWPLQEGAQKFKCYHGRISSGRQKKHKSTDMYSLIQLYPLPVVHLVFE